MAFNTEESEAVVQTGFITSSRGTGGNEAYGELFRGAANTMNNVLQAFDQETRVNIETDAYRAVNETAEAALPPGLKSDLSSVNRLAASKAQGAMTDFEYQARLTEKAKQLKSKYPSGYHSMIDEQLSAASGTSPANRLRQEALSAEQAERQQLSESEKARTTFLDKKENMEILTSQQGMDLYKDITGKDFNPQTASIDEMRAVVMVKTGVDATHKLNMEASKRSAEDAKVAAGDLIQSTLQQQMSNANPIFRKFREQLAQAGSDGRISDDERMALRPLWNDFKASFRIERDKFLYNSGHEGISKLTQNDLNDLIAGSEQSLKGYDDIFESPTAANLKMLEDSNKLIFEASKNAILTNPEYKTISSYLRLKAAGFDPLTIDEAMKDAAPNGEMSPFQKMSEEIGKAVSLGVISGKFNILEGFRLGGSEMSTDTKKHVIQNWGNLLAKPDTTPEQKVMLAETIFADGNKDLLDTYAKNDPMQLFRLLVNPEVTAAMLSNDRARAQYMEWANTQSLTFARRLGKELEASQINAEMGALVFKDGRFSVDENILLGVLKSASSGGVTAGATLAAWEYAKLRDMRKQTEQMNAYITQMEPVWKAMGWDVNEGLLNAINSDPTKARKEGNWFTQMNQLILQGIQSEEEPASSGTKDKQGSVSGEESSDNLAGGISFSRVVAAGKGWTTVELPDGRQVTRKGSRNWRNNNPGNIEFGNFAKNAGAIGTDGRFAVFPDLETGRRAKERLLFESKGYSGLTLGQAVHRWAPPFENDTGAYARSLANAAGVSVDTPMSSLSASQRAAVLKQMEKVEGFKVGKEIEVSTDDA